MLNPATAKIFLLRANTIVIRTKKGLHCPFCGAWMFGDRTSYYCAKGSIRYHKCAECGWNFKSTVAKNV